MTFGLFYWEFMASKEDLHYMQRALRLARKGMGRTAPNPMVGAVVVNGGEIVAEGYHRRAGLPHAERAALEQVGDRARGGTLYVNLEPCNHFGRTPPCTQIILEKGLRKVVFGMEDPNPGVKGGGASFMLSRGIEVVSGVLEEACRQLNEVFIHWITTGRPFVYLKAAISLDGRIATRTGDSKWISNDRSRRKVHELRNRVDGIVAGIGTILKDDPQLTVRLPRGKIEDPRRIIIDPRLRISPQARLLEQPEKVIIAASEKGPEKKRQLLERQGVEVLILPDQDGRLSIRDLLTHLGQKGITSLLVEGGAEVYGSFLQEKQVNKLVLFIAPLLIGGRQAKGMIGGTGANLVTEAVRLQRMKVSRLAGDILVEAYPEK
jgi:diaminohydroxyphosphoribosylaminopyrimidine deaminase / 5-amino-6-(5-phosphoribosylamino)uracil reductase